MYSALRERHQNISIIFVGSHLLLAWHVETTLPNSCSLKDKWLQLITQITSSTSWNISRKVWGPSSKSTAGISWVLLVSNSKLSYIGSCMCVLQRQFKILYVFVKGGNFLLGLKKYILGLWIWNNVIFTFIAVKF